MMTTRLEAVQEKIYALASVKKRRVYLPEAGDDVRTLKAALAVARKGFALPVLVGERAKVEAIAEGENLNITPLELVDPRADESLLSKMAESYRTKRAKENLTSEDAIKVMSDPLYFAAEA
jgi:phosphotransacetylase